MNYQRILMYVATVCSACWFVLGVTFSIWEAYYASVGFLMIAGLYWDQDT